MIADAISWVLTEKTNLSAKVNGAGLCNTPDVADFFDWLVSPDSVNCQIVLDVPSADGGVIFEGAFHLTEFALTGDRGGKVENTISLASDGDGDVGRQHLMSGTGEASADFAGETRDFRIRLGEIRHIEEKCGVGIGEVCRRLARAVLCHLQGRAGLDIIAALATGIEVHAEDVRAPIYEGLDRRRKCARPTPPSSCARRSMTEACGGCSITPRSPSTSCWDRRRRRRTGGAPSGGEPRDPAERTDFAQIYGVGAAIGLTPREVDELTPGSSRPPSRAGRRRTVRRKSRCSPST
jgi:hypothetical protein